MLTIRAWACGLRRKAAWTTPAAREEARVLITSDPFAEISRRHDRAVRNKRRTSTMCGGLPGGLRQRRFLARRKDADREDTTVQDPVRWLIHQAKLEPQRHVADQREPVLRIVVPLRLFPVHLVHSRLGVEQLHALVGLVRRGAEHAEEAHRLRPLIQRDPDPLLIPLIEDDALPAEHLAFSVPRHERQDLLDA